jgi:hypothetical protein
VKFQSDRAKTVKAEATEKRKLVVQLLTTILQRPLERYSRKGAAMMVTDGGTTLLAFYLLPVPVVGEGRKKIGPAAVCGCFHLSQ